MVGRDGYLYDFQLLAHLSAKYILSSSVEWIQLSPAGRIYARIEVYKGHRPDDYAEWRFTGT